MEGLLENYLSKELIMKKADVNLGLPLLIMIIRD